MGEGNAWGVRGEITDQERRGEQERERVCMVNEDAATFENAQEKSYEASALKIYLLHEGYNFQH